MQARYFSRHHLSQDLQPRTALIYQHSFSRVDNKFSENKAMLRKLKLSRNLLSSMK